MPNKIDQAAAHLTVHKPGTATTKYRPVEHAVMVAVHHAAVTLAVLRGEQTSSQAGAITATEDGYMRSLDRFITGEIMTLDPLGPFIISRSMDTALNTMHLSAEPLGDKNLKSFQKATRALLNVLANPTSS